MIECILPAATAPAALPLTPLTPTRLQAWLADRSADQRHWVDAAGFTAAAGQLLLLPGPSGLAGALAGIGAAEDGPWAFGFLAFALPAGTTWRLEGLELPQQADAVLGFALGAYRYSRFKAPPRAPARLVLPDAPAAAAALAAAEATFLVRDLINHPANLLGPAELTGEVLRLATEFGAEFAHHEGTELERRYPALAAVGRGSARGPRVAELRWAGAGPAAPLVALCGKGVCFDTGGYDLKPAAGMLRMKKDMGGAAIAIGLARMIMAARLPLRLRLLVGAVENAVGAGAMRPLDVLQTRAGLSVEVGNTDAEGRLVLCDLLADADADRPALLLDFATLTGAARVALGPDLPAMFTTRDALAEALAAAGQAVADPCWRLPLWDGYASWLDSKTAAMNNVATRPMAGAIIAALFLRRFVAPATDWAHFDVYAWNDNDRPGRPEGGEAQAMRACFEMLRRRFAD